MKNSKLNKKELRVFTTLVYDYLNKTYSEDLFRSLKAEDVRCGLNTGTLEDLRAFAEICANVSKLKDPSCAYTPYFKSDYCIYDIYDSVVLHHENLPDGMWKDFFDVLLKIEKENAEFNGGITGWNGCDEFIVEFLNEENLRWWIEDNISKEEYQNYKAVYDSGMEEILSEPATGFLWGILHDGLGDEQFNELKTSL